jgi:outer membrane protein OmpA-like peptidoglycan-associated protein
MEASTWRVDASKNHCSLSHVIPHFGMARFSQASSKRLQFEIDTVQPPVTPQSVRLVSHSPHWIHENVERDLGYAEFNNSKTPLTITREKALRLFYELEQGRMPVLLFDDWADATDQVEVRLSPVRFRESFAAFQKCTDQLVFLDFEPLSEHTINFSTNSTALKRATRKSLQRVAREFKKQPAARIILGGHSDERGSDGYNMSLSKRRTAFVARYLISRGVPKRMIEQRHFGESLPVNEQSGQMAWAKNRRVTVWLAK